MGGQGGMSVVIRTTLDLATQQTESQHQAGRAAAALLTRSDSDRAAVEPEWLDLCGPLSV